jgi:hypothetical protein
MDLVTLLLLGRALNAYAGKDVYTNTLNTRQATMP